jgi:uncharacterized protein YdhG (YjbR/CyaY superfamily)
MPRVALEQEYRAGDARGVGDAGEDAEIATPADIQSGAGHAAARRADTTPHTHMAAKRSSRKPATSAQKRAATGNAPDVFTPEERAAMRDHVRELKAARSRPAGAADESGVLAKIAEMAEPDRAMAERLHAIIKSVAPALAPRLWYGMPAYAKDGSVICFFQDARKFKTRYSTLGFTDKAALDDGEMWPAAFALKELTPAVEARITELLKKALR